jgi:UDPglucose 6-dehydrogenase
MKKIFVIGIWHLGSVVSACLGDLGNQIFCFDYDSKVREDLRKGKLPIEEPELTDLFSKGNINVEDNLEKIKECDFVYLAFDTPLDNQNKPDLQLIHQAIRDSIPYLKNQIIIISSQIPVGTSDKILQILSNSNKGNEICYTPENLRLGNAINCYMKPERMVFGLSSEDIKKDIEELFLPIKTEKHFTTLKIAEMLKHTLNAYLATLISFSGEISDICEKQRINAYEVIRLLKLDERVSKKAPLEPGLGFSGGTLKRDLQVLRGLQNTLLIDAVFKANEWRAWKLPLIILSKPYKSVGILGVTYKKGTDTLRDSPAINLMKNLKGINFYVYDPLCREKIVGAKVCSSIKEVAENSEVIVIFTDYDEFKEIVNYDVDFIIDTKRLLKDMKIKQDHYIVGDVK